MSILYGDQNVYIISHEQFIKEIYYDTKHLLQEVSFSFNIDLFNIVNPYLRDMQSNHNRDNILNGLQNKKTKKRSFDIDNSSVTEVNLIRTKFHEIMKNEGVKLIFNCNCEGELSNNLEARSASKIHFENVSKYDCVFNGKNDNNIAITVTVHDKEYIVPSMCKFYNCDVLNLLSKLQEDSKFDFILLDPPWWNKYIRRKKKKNEGEGYKMMYDTEISSIPIQHLITNNGLVAVWCTNSPSHLKALVDEIFPSWGIKYVSTWYWLKVTKKGEPICEFSVPPGKQPYERIVFGSLLERSKFYKQPEDNKIIISVPSAIHSHKPPLKDVMKDYLDESPKCLELFARYLLPGWSSCGDQVLSLQNLSLYTKKPISSLTNAVV